MNDRPLVSIIINNYNYGRFLGEAIDSALKQTYPDTEVIVVDDGSTDNSREIIDTYKESIIPVLKDNGGQASAFNAGFAATKGDIICFLDSDDIFLPEKAEKIVNVFRDFPDIGWCFHRQKVMDVNTGALLKRQETAWNAYATVKGENQIQSLAPEKNSSRKCDFRADFRRGKVSFNAPATSGTCFTRSLMQQIFPLPEYEALKTAADRHVKFMALAQSLGFFLDEDLTIQRVHGNNAYTAVKGKEQHKVRSFTLTAYWMKAKLPETARFTNNLFASGLGLYWRIGEIDPKSREYIQNYLSAASPIEKLEIRLRAFYHRLKVW